MQQQYVIWGIVFIAVMFILYRRFFRNRLKDLNVAVKIKSRLVKKLTKQGRKDADLKHCLYGVQIKKLYELNDAIEDKDIYCLVVVWKRRRDFCVDLPELIQGFQVFESVLGKDHQTEPCPLPKEICHSCGCPDKERLSGILHEDPTSQEAGSIG